MDLIPWVNLPYKAKWEMKGRRLEEEIADICENYPDVSQIYMHVKLLWDISTEFSSKWPGSYKAWIEYNHPGIEIKGYCSDDKTFSTLYIITKGE